MLALFKGKNSLNIGNIQGRLTPPMLALFKGDNSSRTFRLQSVFNIQKWVVIDRAVD